MAAFKSLSLSASVILAVAGGTSAFAQEPNYPWVEMDSTSIGLGLAGQFGEGILHLPNLGTNCTYPFRVSGFGGGLQAGISQIAASGAITGLKRISDLTGDYLATQGEATVIAGAGATQMKNSANNVRINLASNTRGAALGFGAQGMKIEVTDPPVNAPTQYMTEFGYNKTWVSQEARDTLNQIAAAWKCRPVNIWVFGFTDSVGHEDANLELSAKRAEGVRQYLIGTGVAPNRVFTQAMGKTDQRVPTPDNTRLRTNRAAVVMIQDM
jgi:outer membrane protein OmpA-like peptidoglycan-associated protein